MAGGVPAAYHTPAAGRSCVFFPGKVPREKPPQSADLSSGRARIELAKPCFHHLPALPKPASQNKSSLSLITASFDRRIVRPLPSRETRPTGKRRWVLRHIKTRLLP